MLAELLAVVGSEHDDRVVEQAAAAEPVEEPGEPAVEIRHLGVVERLQPRDLLRGQLVPALDVHHLRVGDRIVDARRRRSGDPRTHVRRRIVRRVRLHEVEVEQDGSPVAAPTG